MGVHRVRVGREAETVRTMIGMYCRAHHDTGADLCPECRKLSDYALKRLKACPFQEEKPTCAKCPIHCYKPEMRQKVREVMRYSGPRMAYRHPLMAFYHWRDGRCKPKGAKKDDRGT